MNVIHLFHSCPNIHNCIYFNTPTSSSPSPLTLPPPLSLLDRQRSDLSEHLAHLDGRVRLIQSTGRLGVAGCSSLGASEALGEVLVFMDSHCECHAGWLEPLLERVAQDRYTGPLNTHCVHTFLFLYCWSYKSDVHICWRCKQVTQTQASVNCKNKRKLQMNVSNQHLDWPLHVKIHHLHFERFLHYNISVTKQETRRNSAPFGF